MNKHGYDMAVRFLKAHDLKIIPLYFPLPDAICTCGKADCTSQGKHPRENDWVNRGVKGADGLQTLEDRYGRRLNIGVLTGPTNGIVVIDVDPKHAGDVTLAGWIAEHGELPATLTVETGRVGEIRGQHLYFQYPDFEVGNKIGSIGAGIDVKAKGGMVVGPGSLHLSGVTYSCENPEVPIAPMPAWLAARIREKQSADVRKETTPSATPGSRSEVTLEGKRNNFLFWRACRFLKAGVPPEELLERLQEENQTCCDPMLSDSEVEAIAASAVKYVECFSEGDLGNCRRFTIEHSSDVKYVGKFGKFLVYDGNRWKMDEDGEVERKAKATVSRLLTDAMDEQDPERQKDMMKHAHSSTNRSRIIAMIELAKSERGIAASPDDFDNTPFLFNVGNGTLNLKTGKLQPHRREDMITRITAINYDSNAHCPNFEKFMKSITGGDPLLINYLKKSTGYSLTGSMIEQCWFLLYGIGSNGKSTLLDLLTMVFGEYAQMIPTATLLAKKTDGVPNDLARLKGVRFVTAAESEAGRYLAEGLIKQLTGGDKLAVRFLFQEFFDLTPECKIFFATNHRPKVKGTDDGTWRRMRAIPFLQQFRDVREYAATPDHLRKDLNLKEKLEKELPGILRWAVEGCMLWQQESLIAPPAVAAATAEYRSQMDVVAAFLDDRCNVQHGQRCETSDLYRAFHDWCEANGEQARTNRDFSQDLSDRGFEKRRSGSGGRFEYHGLCPLHEYAEQAAIETPLDFNPDTAV